MPFINVNDAQFYYEQHGIGWPIILVAGYTCNAQSWLPLVELLKHDFQVTIFDNRAVGQTSDNGESLSVDLMARDVIGLAQALDIDKPIIVGQSMGGTIAQTVASLYPEQISNLVLCVTTAKWRQAMLKGLSSTLEMRKNNLDFDFIFDAVMPWIDGENFLSKTDLSEVKKQILNEPYPQSLEDQIRQFKILLEFNGIDNLKNIIAPTLICYGREDLLALPYEAEFMADNILKSKVKIFDCAHALPEEETEQLALEIKNFCLLKE